MKPGLIPSAAGRFKINRGFVAIFGALMLTVTFLTEDHAVSADNPSERSPASTFNLIANSDPIAVFRGAVANRYDPFAPAGGRVVRVVSASGVRGGDVLVAIETDSQGDETVHTFSVSFDPTKLSISNISGTNNNPDVLTGSGSPVAQRVVNATQVATGRIGVLLDHLGPLSAGVRQIVLLRFRVLPSAGLGVSPLTFGNVPIALSTTNARSEDLALTPVNGTVSVIDGTPTPTPTPLPVITIGDVSVQEGNTGTTAAVFMVSISGPRSQSVSVNVATADFSARAPSDYMSIAPGATLTFLPGTGSEQRPVTVLVNGDTLSEPLEEFFVNLSNPVNATVQDGQGVGTIVDDDGLITPTPTPTAELPRISITDVFVHEPNVGTTAVQFSVSISGPRDRPATVSFATADGTAVAPSDYIAILPGAELTFPPGPVVTGRTITVLINGDLTPEQEEFFFVNLSNPVNATILDGQGRGTIAASDVPSLRISTNVQVQERSGAVAVFTVFSSGPRYLPATVSVATENGTATAPSDYTAIPAGSTLTFPPGTDDTQQTITVPLGDDDIPEELESFRVILSDPVNATFVGRSSGTAFIFDNDPGISISDVVVQEGNSGTTAANFVVTITGNRTQSATVRFYTSNGSATAPSDYSAIPLTPVQSLTFPPGSEAAQQTITVMVNGDVTPETDEVFFVFLFPPTGASLYDSVGQGTIVADDGFPPVAQGPRTAFDYDGDQRADISIFRPSVGEWYVQRSTAGPVGAQWGLATDRIVPGDYDGDRRTDFAVYRPADFAVLRPGEWFILQSSNFTLKRQVMGEPNDLPAPADFDGDGATDLAVFTPSSGRWFRLNSSTGNFIAFQFGAMGDRPVAQDLDGDGRADYAVYRPSSGIWYQQRSATNTFHAEAFGTATDTIVPGDYDGDRKTDLAVYRPATGTWYIKSSITGGFTGVQFGLPNDQPAAADYDGDGRFDICLFRAGEGEWYRLNSSNGQFNAFRFGLPGDRPTASAFQ